MSETIKRWRNGQKRSTKGGTSLPGTLRAPAFCRFLAACHLDPLTVHQGIGDLAPGLVQVPPRGLPGDPQFYRRFFLFEPLKIDETDQLDLLGLQGDPAPLLLRAAAGLVTTGFRGSCNGAPESRPSPAGAFILGGNLIGHYRMLTDRVYPD